MIDFNWDEIGKNLDRKENRYSSAKSGTPEPYTTHMSPPTPEEVDAAGEWTCERGVNEKIRSKLEDKLPGDLHVAVTFLMRLANGFMWYDPEASRHAPHVLHVAIRIILAEYGLTISELAEDMHD